MKQVKAIIDYSKISIWVILFLISAKTMAQINMSSDNYDTGYSYYQKGEYKKALSFFLMAANKNDKNSEWMLGVMYEHGYGVAMDYFKAFEWYHKASEHGQLDALCSLGDMYARGLGIDQDYTKAYEYISKSAKQGNKEAQWRLGELYDGGYGVKQDYSKALEWHTKAAEQGCAYSQGVIGYYYLYGYGTTQDFNKAYEWSVKGATQEDALSQCNLGDLYYLGNGIPKDFAKAYEWYIKSAEQGYPYAQSNVGYMYYHGEGVKKDNVKALEWFTKAADQGNTNAMNNIGWYYYDGDGSKKNYKEAEIWFNKAIEKDPTMPQAYSNLAILYAKRDKDYIKALQYSDLALERLSNVIPKVQATIYGERAKIYVWQGNLTNAKEILKECLALNPNYLSEDEELAKMIPGHPNDNEIDNNIPTTNNIQKNVFAIIIGNEKYKNEVVVPYADNDAKVFCKYVEKTLGVPNEQIKYIENATYNDIRIATNWLIQAMKVCRGKGKAIVYYAGHGIPNESDMSAYLLPVDGIGNDPGSAYALDELYEKLGGIEAQSVTIFLDACFSGSKREKGMLSSARGVAIKVKPSKPKGNLIIFSATQGDETAYPYKDKQHGLFTYYLLKKLQESKGEVTLGELSDYLTDEVGHQSFLKNNKIQTPTVIVAPPLQNTWKNLKLK